MRHMHRLKVIFIGKVQGVGFRATARKKALELGVSGSVQNLDDGSVLAILQGDLNPLFALIRDLSGIFTVTNIEIAFDARDKSLEGFHVL